jgi:hypothetical protein
MAACKPGKEKNAHGRCVKIKSECKAGKEKNVHGRCVKKCTQTQRRNRAGKCVSLKKPISYSIKTSSSSKKYSYKKPLPIPAGHFRGMLLTKKRHLKKIKYSTASTPYSTGHSSNVSIAPDPRFR